MSLSILGLGTVCALGSGVENFRLGLKGERQPDVVDTTVKGLEQPMSLPVYQAQIDELDRFIPRRALRRIDGFAKMALLSTHLALEDAGMRIENKARVGIVVGSGYGPIRTTFDFLDGIIDDGDHCALPTHFANSVHNALASQISIFLDIQGPCTTITCFDNTVANVLMTARNWLKDGTVDFVIAGLGDEYNDVLGYSALFFPGKDISLFYSPGIREQASTAPSTESISTFPFRKQRKNFTPSPAPSFCQPRGCYPKTSLLIRSI